MNTIKMDRIYTLVEAYKSGRLGGEKMPEDENPALGRVQKKTTYILHYLWHLIIKGILIHCGRVQTEHIRKLFSDNEYSVQNIKEYIGKNKKKFPYLGGNKICNYWLYVMEQYTDVKFVDRENITVAPDTHVIQASTKLGIISLEEAGQADVQEIVAKRWQDILKGTDLVPIDVHTPMWLWSRGKFTVEI